MKNEPKNHGTYWTVGDMWSLAIMYDSGLTWESIARSLKRTENACKIRMHLIKTAFILCNGVDSDHIMSDLVVNQNAVGYSKIYWRQTV